MKENKATKKSRFRNDIILIAALLAVSAALLVYLYMFRGGGNTVKVTVDGELYGIYSLSQNISLDITTGKNGENINRFVIDDGKVFMEKASCPDGICVSHSPITRSGESIVCLPNRVVISVSGDGDAESPDIVA